MENKIFNNFFTEIFVFKMFSKVSNKIFGEKHDEIHYFPSRWKIIYSTAFIPKFLFLLAFIN